MYKELNKYKTKNERPCNFAEIHLNPNNTIFTYQESEYVAGFGDLINDFIEHKNKPFWRRKYNHNHMTKLYIQMLNEITITHWF